MSPDVLVVLPLAAFCLWLTLFLFAVVDHTIHRFSYGRFLAVLRRVQASAGSGPAATAEVTRHMLGARKRYLASYVAKAASNRAAAAIASRIYLEWLGEDVVLERASQSDRRRLGRRITALYVLARTGHPKVLPLLEEAVGSRQPVLAYAAMDMLDICDSVAAAEVLVQCIEAGVLPASRIATQLEHFRIELTDLYLSRLARGNPASRYWIAYLLGKSPYSVEAEHMLGDLLSDPEDGVRKIALASLGSLGAPCLQMRARSMLRDPAFFVRTQAVRILAGFPEPETVAALLPMLSDPEDAVQLAAKKSLVAIGLPALELIEGARLQVDHALGAKLGQVARSIGNEALAEAVSAGRV